MKRDIDNALLREIDQFLSTNATIDEFEVLAIDICGHFSANAIRSTN